MITVRIEYGGMRAERTATDYAAAWRQLATMYTAHGVDVDPRDPMRGVARVTRARVKAQFIETTTTRELVK